MESWIVWVAVAAAVFAYALCKVAGDCSREEERQEQNLQKEKEKESNE